MKNIKKLLSSFFFVIFLIACADDFHNSENQDHIPVETKALKSEISLAGELSTFTLSATNGIATMGGYYWNQTYNSNKFTTASFTFSYTANQDWNYWDGFTVSNIADTHNYGVGASSGNPGSSTSWLPHQWGAMAVPTGTNTPSNFLVGYWGCYMLDNQYAINDNTIFGENKYSNWVKLGNNTNSYTVDKVTVSIHPWLCCGNLNGDGFARKFEKGDHFDLIMYGVKSNGKFATNQDDEVISIIYKMADYTRDSLVMSTGWEDILSIFNNLLSTSFFSYFLQIRIPLMARILRLIFV